MTATMDRRSFMRERPWVLSKVKYLAHPHSATGLVLHLTPRRPVPAKDLPDAFP